MPVEVKCPECGLSDQVEKVSTLYLVGIEMRRGSKRAAASEAGSSGLSARATEMLLDRRRTRPGVEALERKLSPPSSGKPSATRPIHPDLAVLAFSLIVPVFLYGIVTSQESTLVVVLGVLAVFYLLYFWQRGRLVARFEAEQDRRKHTEQLTARAIERWMKLHYCGREELVFDPGTRESVPVDQMMGLIWEAERGK